MNENFHFNEVHSVENFLPNIKEEKDVRIAYQKQMLQKWRNDIKSPKWTGVGQPSFYTKTQIY